MKVLVPGGAGFIGSHFVRLLLGRGHGVRVLDKLTYAGNVVNLADCARETSRYEFQRGDIADPSAVARAMEGVDCVVNFAAETHVDRSIHEPGAFVRTDVLGVHVLLEAVRSAPRKIRFVQVSTDEVYGSADRAMKETDILNPSSPYSASKAGGDLLALGYHKTFGVDLCVTRASNNYGPYQFPEKLIPLMIMNAMDDKPLPVYGDGSNVRDWLYVEEHAEAILLVLEKGAAGEIYNIGGDCERPNLAIVERILSLLSLGKDRIRFVRDRPAHDLRYSLDSSKIRALGWSARTKIEDGLARTVDWYRSNEAWWRPVRGEAFRAYYEKQYGAS